MISNIIRGVFKINNWIKRFTQLEQIPLANVWLGLVPISPSVLVRMVANKIRVVMLHPSKWAIVDCQP